MQGAPGRVLLHELTVRFYLGDDGKPRAEETHLRQSLINGERDQWLRVLQLGYSETFDVVHEAAVSARFPDGTEKSWGRDTGSDVPATPGWVLYSDDRVLRIAPPSVPPGSVVATFARTTRSSPELFPYGLGLGSSVPVERARLVVEVPAGFDVEHVAEKSMAPVRFDPQVEQLEGGARRLTWERTDIPERCTITRGLAWCSRQETVLLRLASWPGADGTTVHGPADERGASRFAWQIKQGKDQPDEHVANTVRQVLADAPADKRARAALLYAWVRDHVRYCAISVGMGGWVPHAASEVHEVRYGDCKDKANLLRTMLAVDGIDAQVALIWSGDWPERFRLPVLAANFNHVIVQIELPGGTVTVDPTSRTTPFADLPDVDEDRLLLPVTREGASLTPAGASSPERDVRDEQYTLTLSDDGMLAGTFTSTMNGAYADVLRERLLVEPPGRYREIAHDEIAFWEPVITEVTYENAAPPVEITPVTAQGRMQIALVRGGLAGQDVVLRARALLGTPFPAVDLVVDGAPREGPFFLGHQRTARERLTIALPPSLRAGRVPAPIDLDSPFGHYRCEWRVSDDGHTVELVRESTRRMRLVPADQVPALHEFAQRVLTADEEPLALVEAEGP